MIAGVAAKWVWEGSRKPPELFQGLENDAGLVTGIEGRQS